MYIDKYEYAYTLYICKDICIYIYIYIYIYINDKMYQQYFRY